MCAFSKILFLSIFLNKINTKKQKTKQSKTTRKEGRMDWEMDLGFKFKEQTLWEEGVKGPTHA